MQHYFLHDTNLISYIKLFLKFALVCEWVCGAYSYAMHGVAFIKTH